MVCFIGDGGFYYHLTELETASRCGINVVTVVNNNQYLRQCVDGINQAYGDRPGNRDEQCKFDLRIPDFAHGRPARSRSIRAVSASGWNRSREITPRGASKKALSLEDNPVVVDVITDPACKAPNPVDAAAYLTYAAATRK